MAFTLPIPPDTAIITDDGGVTGWALVSVATGAFLGFAPLPRAAFSESGNAMLDGTIGTPDNTSGAGNGVFGIYDNELNLITNTIVGTIPSFLVGTTSDKTTYFYVVSADGSNNLTAHRVDKSGVTLQSWNLSTVSAADPLTCAATRDNAFLYFESNLSGTVKKIDLNTSSITTVATLGTRITGMEIDTDGNIYVNRDVGGIAKVEKYDSSFSLINSVNGGPVDYGVDRLHISSDDEHVITWTQKSSGIAHPNLLSALRKIRMSDLAVISDVTDIPTESNSGFINEGSELSNSCPLLISGSPSVSSGRDDCPGGALTGSGPGGGGDAWCRSCDSTVTVPPQNWPAALLADLISVGISNCWDITFIYAVEPLFNARGFTGQVNSAGQLRGRFYQGFPTPDFSAYFDTNGPDCEWLYSPHGITII